MTDSANNAIYAGGVKFTSFGEAPIETQKEMVNHPSHYSSTKYEPIDVIEDWGLNFHLGNTVKYIARCGKKDDAIQDLRKARWYLDREITRREKEAISNALSGVADSIARPADDMKSDAVIVNYPYKKQ